MNVSEMGWMLITSCISGPEDEADMNINTGLKSKRSQRRIVSIVSIASKRILQCLSVVRRVLLCNRVRCVRPYP